MLPQPTTHLLSRPTCISLQYEKTIPHNRSSLTGRAFGDLAGPNEGWSRLYTDITKCVGYVAWRAQPFCRSLPVAAVIDHDNPSLTLKPLLYVGCNNRLGAFVEYPACCWWAIRRWLLHLRACKPYDRIKLSRSIHRIHQGTKGFPLMRKNERRQEME